MNLEGIENRLDRIAEELEKRREEAVGNFDSEYLARLRDQFAAAALSGMLTVNSYNHQTPYIAAKEAYEYADAMLAERKKEKK